MTLVYSKLSTHSPTSTSSQPAPTSPALYFSPFAERLSVRERNRGTRVSFLRTDTKAGTRGAGPIPVRMKLCDDYFKCDRVLKKPGSISSLQISMAFIAYFVCLQPFIVRPTLCWRLDWEDLESNQQHFYALCSVLKERVTRELCYHS